MRASQFLGRALARRGIGLLAMGAASVVAASGSARGEVEMAYEVGATPDLSDLQVEVELPPGLGAVFTVDPEATAFMEGVVRADSGGWTAVPRASDGWRAPSCQRSGCRIRYLFHLRAAAQTVGDPDTACLRGGAIVAPASTWLLRPVPLPLGTRAVLARLHVTVPRPLVFVSGLPRVPGVADTYSFALLPGFVSPYAAFGAFDDEALEMGGARLELAIASPALTADAPRIRAWVIAAARAVTAYFGRFPVSRALILVVPQATGVHGKALGGGGATVLLQVAPGVDLTDSRIDWQATHEMVHLAVPELARAQIWLSEGLATYIEPLARTLTGELRPASVWGDLMEGLPKGEPEAGDHGLNRTHTWGRVYWGGALFAFVADLEIRKATHGAQSLGTALRGVLAGGGDARVPWSVERFLTAGDRALGRSILIDLYQRMATHPVAVDLPALWRELGVSLSQGQVTFDDEAPLAAIRRALIGGAPQTTDHR